MKLLHKRELGIYPVTFIFTSDKELFKESSGKDVSNMSDGCVFTDDGKTSNIWMYIEQNDTGAINVQVLVHECFHASIFTAEMMGVELDYHNDEPLAYLADWFAGAVLDFNRIDNESVEDVPPNGETVSFTTGWSKDPLDFEAPISICTTGLVSCKTKEDVGAMSDRIVDMWNKKDKKMNFGDEPSNRTYFGFNCQGNIVSYSGKKIKTPCPHGCIPATLESTGDSEVLCADKILDAINVAKDVLNEAHRNNKTSEELLSAIKGFNNAEIGIENAFKDNLLDNQETIIKIVKQALAREGRVL